MEYFNPDALSFIAIFFEEEQFQRGLESMTADDFKEIFLNALEAYQESLL